MVKTNSFTDNRSQDDTVTILEGESETEVFDSHGARFAGLNLPDAFTSSQLFFQSSSTANGVYQDLYNIDGVRFTAEVAPARNIRWDAIDFQADRYIKILSKEIEPEDRILTLTFIPW